MTSVDVFGKSKKKSTATIKIVSNGGLNLANDFLSVKVDPNSSNILSLSAKGVMVDGIKSNDAATKSYVDIKKVKNTCGFIPQLHSNVSKQGFIVTASNEFNWKYEACNAFKNTLSEWITRNKEAFLQINLPFPIAIWAFALRGRWSDSERWYNWAIEASNDDVLWTILYSATDDYLGNITKFYHLETITGDKYLYYRFYGHNAEPTNPGLSYMQIYSLDDLM